MTNITLAKIIDVICWIASKEKNINMTILQDIYRLDSLPDAKYCVFGLTQDIHYEDETFMHYNFFLYYINRTIIDDGSNEILNQSTGIEVLRNIIRKTCQELNIDVSTDIQYYPFIQKFTDVCAGVYADVTFDVPLEMCAEEYDFDGE